MNKDLNEALKEIFKKLEDLCEGTKAYADEIRSDLYSLDAYYDDVLDDEDE